MQEWLIRDPRDAEGGDEVEFRLSYAGPLYASTNRDPQANHKHELRKHFHPQLKRLWNDYEHLKEMQHPLPEDVITVNAPPPPERVKHLAEQFAYFGTYNFVPLVTEDLVLKCGNHVLFLRPEKPGKILQNGDIDNRIKTLFDALKMPKQLQEVGDYTSPGEDERPFYCLAQDDRLITSLAVETDLLLEPIDGKHPSASDARLVITVTIRPARLTYGNMGFV